MNIKGRNPACCLWPVWLLLLLARSSLQEAVYFVTQPEAYYYSYEGRLTEIPCEAVRVTETGDVIPIDATPMRDGEPLITGSLPARHRVRRRTGVVDGVVVERTQVDDEGVGYWCQVEIEGHPGVFTRQTHILVGDGRPLAVSGVDLTDQFLYSVALEWDEPPVPSDSPITGYNISVLPVDSDSGELEVDVDQNSTWVQLSPLDPGSAYLVAVAGVNSNGVGKFSEYQTVMTLSPEVPRPPTDVTVEAVVGSTSTSLIVSWTPSPIDPEVMTPLMSYIIYYGPPGTSSGGAELALSEVVPVAEGSVVSGYTVTGVTVGGEVRVGVAAVNSAGASQVAYYQHTVGVGCSVLSPPDNGMLSQTGLATDSEVNYSCRQGFTLTGNKTRLCSDQGLWAGSQPLCTEDSDDDRTFLFIVIISLGVAVGLTVVIIAACILILVFWRKRVRMGKEGHAKATFENASPPLKRHGKPRSTSSGGSNNAFGEPEIGLAILRYAEEPRAVGTPPPHDPTTFQQPSPPSSVLPPSYSDLEQTLSPNDERQTNSTQALFSNCSPPTGGGASGVGPSSDESASNKIPLSVSYSNEPRTAGSTPSPHPPNDSRQDSLEESYRSEAYGTTRILD